MTKHKTQDFLGKEARGVSMQKGTFIDRTGYGIQM